MCPCKAKHKHQNTDQRRPLQLQDQAQAQAQAPLLQRLTCLVPSPDSESLLFSYLIQSLTPIRYQIFFPPTISFQLLLELLPLGSHHLIAATGFFLSPVNPLGAAVLHSITSTPLHHNNINNNNSIIILIILHHHHYNHQKVDRHTLSSATPCPLSAASFQRKVEENTKRERIREYLFSPSFSSPPLYCLLSPLPFPIGTRGRQLLRPFPPCNFRQHIHIYRHGRERE